MDRGYARYKTALVSRVVSTLVPASKPGLMHTGKLARHDVVIFTIRLRTIAGDSSCAMWLA
jgi:hypothetical protein